MRKIDSFIFSLSQIGLKSETIYEAMGLNQKRFKRELDLEDRDELSILYRSMGKAFRKIYAELKEIQELPDEQRAFKIQTHDYFYNKFRKKLLENKEDYNKILLTLEEINIYLNAKEIEFPLKEFKKEDEVIPVGIEDVAPLFGDHTVIKDDDSAFAELDSRENREARLRKFMQSETPFPVYRTIK